MFNLIILAEGLKDLVVGQELINISGSALVKSTSDTNPTISAVGGSTVELSIAQNVSQSDVLTFGDNSSFTTTYNRLYREEIPSTGVFTRNIKFPEESANTVYTVTIQAVSGLDTDLRLSGVKSKRSTTKTISQYTDTTVTFSLVSAGASASYDTLPSNITVVSNPFSSGKRGVIKKEISWPVVLTANSFHIVRQPLVTDFTSTTTQTVDGAISSSASLVLDSVDGLYVGMLTSLSSRTINAIDKTTKTLTLSGTASVADGATVTFTGYGGLGTNIIAGVSFRLNNFKVALTDVTTKVNGAVSSSATVVVDSSAGIKDLCTIVYYQCITLKYSK